MKFMSRVVGLVIGAALLLAPVLTQSAQAASAQDRVEYAESIGTSSYVNSESDARSQSYYAAEHNCRHGAYLRGAIGRLLNSISETFQAVSGNGVPSWVSGTTGVCEYRYSSTSSAVAVAPSSLSAGPTVAAGRGFYGPVFGYGFAFEESDARLIARSGAEDKCAETGGVLFAFSMLTWQAGPVWHATGVGYCFS